MEIQRYARERNAVLPILMEADVEVLTGTVLLERSDEWLLQQRYMQIERMAELTPPLIETDPVKLPPIAA